MDPWYRAATALVRGVPLLLYAPLHRCRGKRANNVEYGYELAKWPAGYVFK